MLHQQHAGTSKIKSTCSWYNVFGLRDQDYSNIIIEGIKSIVVISMEAGVQYLFKKNLGILAVGTKSYRATES